jgi:hypothetical protein
MNNTRCEDLFAPVLFEFDGRNPINALCTIINDDQSLQLNTELAKIFDDEANSLALDYIVNRYDRRMSPLYERLRAHYEDDLEDTNEQIAKIIVMKFIYNWNKLAEGYFANYNPIDNYNMVENRATLLEESVSTSTSETNTNKYNGFNSTEMHDVSESEASGSVETSKTETGGKTNNELTRRGNIGVTTTAQMIRGELELRKKSLLNLIYNDIDTVLFIDYYN